MPTKSTGTVTSTASTTTTTTTTTAAPESQSQGSTAPTTAASPATMARLSSGNYTVQPGVTPLHGIPSVDLKLSWGQLFNAAVLIPDSTLPGPASTSVTTSTTVSLGMPIYRMAGPVTLSSKNNPAATTDLLNTPMPVGAPVVIDIKGRYTPAQPPDETTVTAEVTVHMPGQDSTTLGLQGSLQTEISRDVQETTTTTTVVVAGAAGAGGGDRPPERKSAIELIGDAVQAQPLSEELQLAIQRVLDWIHLVADSSSELSWDVLSQYNTLLDNITLAASTSRDSRTTQFTILTALRQYIEQVVVETNNIPELNLRSLLSAVAQIDRQFLSLGGTLPPATSQHNPFSGLESRLHPDTLKLLSQIKQTIERLASLDRDMHERHTQQLQTLFQEVLNDLITAQIYDPATQREIAELLLHHLHQQLAHNAGRTTDRNKQVLFNLRVMLNIFLRQPHLNSPPALDSHSDGYPDSYPHDTSSASLGSTAPPEPTTPFGPTVGQGFEPQNLPLPLRTTITQIETVLAGLAMGDTMFPADQVLTDDLTNSIRHLRAQMDEQGMDDAHQRHVLGMLINNATGVIEGVDPSSPRYHVLSIVLTLLYQLQDTLPQQLPSPSPPSTRAESNPQASAALESSNELNQHIQRLCLNVRTRIRELLGPELKQLAPHEKSSDEMVSELSAALHIQGIPARDRYGILRRLAEEAIYHLDDLARQANPNHLAMQYLATRLQSEADEIYADRDTDTDSDRDTVSGARSAWQIDPLNALNWHEQRSSEEMIEQLRLAIYELAQTSLTVTKEQHRNLLHFARAIFQQLDDEGVSYSEQRETAQYLLSRIRDAEQQTTTATPLANLTALADLYAQLSERVTALSASNAVSYFETTLSVQVQQFSRTISQIARGEPISSGERHAMLSYCDTLFDNLSAAGVDIISRIEIANTLLDQIQDILNEHARLPSHSITMLNALTERLLRIKRQLEGSLASADHYYRYDDDSSFDDGAAGGVGTRRRARHYRSHGDEGYDGHYDDGLYDNSHYEESHEAYHQAHHSSAAYDESASYDISSAHEQVRHAHARIVTIIETITEQKAIRHRPWQLQFEANEQLAYFQHYMATYSIPNNQQAGYVGTLMILTQNSLERLKPKPRDESDKIRRSFLTKFSDLLRKHQATYERKNFPPPPYEHPEPPESKPYPFRLPTYLRESYQIVHQALAELAAEVPQSHYQALRRNVVRYLPIITERARRHGFHPHQLIEVFTQLRDTLPVIPETFISPRTLFLRRLRRQFSAIIDVAEQLPPEGVDPSKFPPNLRIAYRRVTDELSSLPETDPPHSPPDPTRYPPPSTNPPPQTRDFQRYIDELTDGMKSHEIPVEKRRRLMLDLEIQALALSRLQEQKNFDSKAVDFIDFVRIIRSATPPYLLVPPPKPEAPDIPQPPPEGMITEGLEASHPTVVGLGDSSPKHSDPEPETDHGGVIAEEGEGAPAAIVPEQLIQTPAYTAGVPIDVAGGRREAATHVDVDINKRSTELPAGSHAGAAAYGARVQARSEGAKRGPQAEPEAAAIPASIPDQIGQLQKMITHVACARTDASKRRLQALNGHTDQLFTAMGNAGHSDAEQIDVLQQLTQQIAQQSSAHVDTITPNNLRALMSLQRKLEHMILLRSTHIPMPDNAEGAGAGKGGGKGAGTGEGKGEQGGAKKPKSAKASDASTASKAAHSQQSLPPELADLPQDLLERVLRLDLILTTLATQAYDLPASERAALTSGLRELIGQQASTDLQTVLDYFERRVRKILQHFVGGPHNGKNLLGLHIAKDLLSSTRVHPYSEWGPHDKTFSAEPDPSRRRKRRWTLRRCLRAISRMLAGLVIPVLQALGLALALALALAYFYGTVMNADSSQGFGKDLLHNLRRQALEAANSTVPDSPEGQALEVLTTHLGNAMGPRDSEQTLMDQGLIIGTRTSTSSDEQMPRSRAVPEHTFEGTLHTIRSEIATLASADPDAPHQREFLQDIKRMPATMARFGLPLTVQEEIIRELMEQAEQGLAELPEDHSYYPTLKDAQNALQQTLDSITSKLSHTNTFVVPRY